MNRAALITSILALAVSTVATIVSVRALNGRPQVGGPPPLEATAIEEIEEKVERLARQMEAIKVGLSVRALADARTGAPAAAAAGTGSDTDSPASLAALSRRLGELEQQAEAARERGLLPGPLSAEAVSRAVSTVIDRNASLGDRVAALQKLRPVNGRADGRSPEVTAAVVELLNAPETPDHARREMLRDIDGVDLPILKDSAMAIVSRPQADPETRSQAIETLQPFYSDPQVLATINRLKEADPDSKVRREADRRLREWNEWQARRSR